MRRLVALAAVFASAHAFAQPVTQPSRCEVTYTRVPAHVQRAIESWVSAEPRCTTTLDLRVIPTEGGLYLFARDPQGRIRERVVPDAQSVGVLVASWIADDSTRAPMIVDVLDLARRGPWSAGVALGRRVSDGGSLGDVRSAGPRLGVHRGSGHARVRPAADARQRAAPAASRRPADGVRCGPPSVVVPLRPS